MEDRMSLSDFDPKNPERLKELDPRKYGFDYGDGGPVVFDSNLFRECPSCGGKGWIEINKENGEIDEERCSVCKGTGAVEKG
jgi:hypothetical protein